MNTLQDTDVFKYIYDKWFTLHPNSNLIDLAHSLTISRQTIYNWINSKTKISATHKNLICNKLHLPNEIWTTNDQITLKDIINQYFKENKIVENLVGEWNVIMVFPKRSNNYITGYLNISKTDIGQYHVYYNHDIFNTNIHFKGNIDNLSEHFFITIYSEYNDEYLSFNFTQKSNIDNIIYLGIFCGIDDNNFLPISGQLLIIKKPYVYDLNVLIDTLDKSPKQQTKITNKLLNKFSKLLKSNLRPLNK